MIIGRGSIAQSIIDNDLLVFLASGVSNSSCTDENEYDREWKLIKSIGYDKHIVYFSNLAIYYKNDRYTKHKIEVEEFIRTNFKAYTIVRIEVCTWVQTPTTILNYFRNLKKQGKEPVIQNTTRYVLSLPEFQYWIKLIKPGFKNEMNILGEKMTISEIWSRVLSGEL
jgi:hypothetical protein